MSTAEQPSMPQSIEAQLRDPAIAEQIRQLPPDDLRRLAAMLFDMLQREAQIERERLRRPRPAG